MNFPQYFIDENQIEHLFINKKTLIEICKGVYSLPQAGQLAYIALMKHLQLHGYTHIGFTPGLFKHATRDTLFSLVVDGFGVKYTAKNDALHLINTLKKKYPGITIDWSGRIFLVIHLYWDYTKRTVTLSIPNYVKKTCQYFNIKNLNITNIHHIHMQHRTMDPRSSMHLPVPLPM